MYSQQEASRQRQEFWTSFGQYMRPVPSASGDKVNWINYKTGLRFINFKMNVDAKSAYIGIELSHPAAESRIAFYNQFTFFKEELNTGKIANWQWEVNAESETGNSISRIYDMLYDINIFNKPDWPMIITFLKPRLQEIDQFWAEHKEIFQMMS